MQPPFSARLAPALPQKGEPGAMPKPDVDRRLAAILAADVAGYTRLMEDDEEATLAAWWAARKERKLSYSNILEPHFSLLEFLNPKHV